MNRTEYKKARRQVRDNGYFSLKWMRYDIAATMDKLRCINDETDPLAERASIIAYCQRAGVECNVRHTQARKH